MKSRITSVLVVGAGTMGQQIALQIAKSNCYVTLLDISETNLEKAKAAIISKLPQNRNGNILFSSNLAASVKGVDLVIETISENLKAKRDLFRLLDKICEKDVVFVSNTSDLLPSELAKYTGRAKLFCAYHFHAPQYGADIVDIMPHKDTCPEVLEQLVLFTRDIGLIPVVLKKENRAYIYNNILNSILDTSVQLVLKGVADYKEVDKVWMGNTGMKIGPFGMLDLIGLDTAAEISRIRAKKNPFILFGVKYFMKYISAGKTGMKSGEGFYKYPDPEYSKENFLK